MTLTAHLNFENGSYLKISQQIFMNNIEFHLSNTYDFKHHNELQTK